MLQGHTGLGVTMLYSYWKYNFIGHVGKIFAVGGIFDINNKNKYIRFKDIILKKHNKIIKK